MKSEKPWEADEFRTAYALRDRGPVTIKRSDGEVDARLTEAGTSYIQHGHHPDDPAHATNKKTAEPKAAGRTRSASYADRPVALARRTKDKDLIERLVTDRRVTINEPDEATVTGVAPRDRLREAAHPSPFVQTHRKSPHVEPRPADPAA
ncbi:hypothetical protein [Streptomyces clavifer]|uniref:hypothetical protein n=1 Tax=Streptomyces clavifer TaxID=68188 RepID=UPI0037FFFE25